jgi:hypothetical protein
MHEGLISHGEHLIRRCQGWTDDMAASGAGRRREVA